ncbi:MAG: hypothetical protein OEQ29_01970 [Alphaproteobacteria bacterium]|nr:hypothetical protein [Alphaproteobacteria bacterium]
MKRIIILAAALAASSAAPIAGTALAADSAVAPISVVADGSNAELTINVTGDRRGCGKWYFQWKVQGNTAAGKKWMRNCR